EAPDRQDYAADTLTCPFLEGRARLLAGARQQVGAAGHDLDRLRIAAGSLGRAAHHVEQGHGVDLRADRGEEAVAQPAGTLRRRLRMTADDDGNRTAHRLRIGADLVERDELALE